MMANWIAHLDGWSAQLRQHFNWAVLDLVQAKYLAEGNRNSGPFPDQTWVWPHSKGMDKGKVPPWGPKFEAAALEEKHRCCSVRNSGHQTCQPWLARNRVRTREAARWSAFADAALRVGLAGTRQELACSLERAQPVKCARAAPSL